MLGRMSPNTLQTVNLQHLPLAKFRAVCYAPTKEFAGPADPVSLTVPF